MVSIFGKTYYIDFDAITDKCRITDPTVKEETEEGDESENGKINIFKYEIIKMCIERIFDDDVTDDEKMGLLSASETNVPFRLAFNTLIKNEIIIEDEDE